MEYILVEHHRNVSDEELIKDLKEVALKLGKDKVTIRQYETFGKYNGKTLINKFDSWNKSLEKAGLSITTRMNIPEEELFQNLANLWQHFGRQPKFHEVRQPLSKFSAGTYGNRFGSWYNALRAFISAMNGDIIDTKQTHNEKNATNNPEVSDIGENPLNLDIVEVEAGSIYSLLPDVACAVINCNYALDFGLNPGADFIFQDNPRIYDNNMYVNLIAARTEDKDNEIYKKIADAYHSPEVEKVYAEEFKGAYLPAWK